MKKIENIKQNGRNDALKVLGIVAMAIDHIGLILYPQFIILRVIGRIAFPIFAWYLVQGYAHTSSLKKYALRLGIFALIAQVPFYIATQEKGLNIFFTLLAGLLAIHLFEKKKYFSLSVLVILSGIAPLNYSFYGVLTILAFHIFKERKVILLAQAVVSYVGLYLYGIMQPYSLIGVVAVLYYPKNFIRIRLNKYFFYVFYPAHLLLLYGLSQLLYFAK